MQQPLSNAATSLVVSKPERSVQIQENVNIYALKNAKLVDLCNSPLQLHHVLPTLHVTGSHQRTASTSPFQCLNSGGNTDSVIIKRGNISVVRSSSTNFKGPDLLPPDQISKNTFPTISCNSPIPSDSSREDPSRIYTYSKEEYESEDELRREDIMFHMEGDYLV